MERNMDGHSIITSQRVDMYNYVQNFLMLLATE